MASVPCFFTLSKSIFLISDPSRNFSAVLIPSIIFDLFAPKFTKAESNISPEIPAICGSITITIKGKSLKMNINSIENYLTVH